MKRARAFRTLIGISLFALALTACANSPTILAPDAIKAANERSNLELQKSRYVGPEEPNGPLRERAGLYLAGDTLENSHGAGLPLEYQHKSYAFVNATPMSFREVADLITRETGLPVVVRRGDVVEPKKLDANGKSQDITAGGNPKMAQGPVPEGFDTQRALEAAREARAGVSDPLTGGPALVNATAGTMGVNFTGSLDKFLDLTADTFDLSWTFNNGRIDFSRTEVTTLEIPALPIIMNLAFTLDSGAQTSSTGSTGGSGSGSSAPAVTQTGGSDQKATTTAAFNIWSEIEKTLKSIVGTSGAIDISGSTGLITINAPSVVTKQVKIYVARVNRELSREIVLNVDVYSVTLTNADTYNLNLTAALSAKNAAGVVSSVAGAGATTASNVISGSASGPTAVLSNIGANNGIGAAVLNGPLAGSNALMQALSTQGDVAEINSAAITTLNGIPAPFQVVNTRGYVASVQTTVGAGNSSAVQTSLTPGSVTSGFNLYMVPRVDRNGRILLQYGVNISELAGANNGFDTFTTNSETIQLPNINARNFVQEASIPNNGTLVLTGFEQKKDTVTRSGTGSAFFPFLGGGDDSTHDRQVIVVAISPRVIQLGQLNAVQ